MPLTFTDTARLSARTRRRSTVLAAALIGLAATLWLFVTIRAWETRAEQAAVEAAAAQRVELLRESLGNSLETLHALGSLYANGERIDRAHFNAFADAALGRRPELQALSWTPRVSAGERAAYEERARAEGFEGFEFTERDPATGRMVRARDRGDYYYPVYYIEPLASNDAAFGYDLNARIDTLQRARDSAKATATPLITLMQEKEGQPGFIVYLPLYRGAVPAATGERIRANTGFVAAVFRVADLVRPALANQRGLHTTLRDTAPGASAIAYAAPGTDDSPPAKSLRPISISLPFAGREWEIAFTPTTNFPTGQSAWQSWFILAAGLMLTTAIAFYLHASQRRNEAIAEANAALQREVAERKRAEEAAAAASRAKSDFLANLSHEIRTPLNSILGYTQILERDRSLHPRQHDAVAALANSGHHLLGLLNSILDLSKIEAGRMELQREIFDPAALVRGLAEMFKPRCAEKHIALRITCPEGEPRAVLGDEGKLRQVLINLIGNAVKFTPRGEVFVGVRLLDDAPERWMFEVIDTGIGMSDGERSGLFEPFHQTKAGRRHGGTGLGLAIARGHVALMGGTLAVVSERGVGSRFFFTLPLPVVAAVPASAMATPLPHLAPGVSVRALVIDDNGDNRVILSRLLADLGCAVAKAATAPGARDIVRQDPPDIVFLDVILADTTGPELLAELHEDGLPAETPVLFHTAAMLDHARREELRACGADLLAKPFRIEDLCACLKRLPGVRFEMPSPAGAPEPVSPEELERVVLPDELCARMTIAAELHSTTVLKACLEELRELGGPAAPLAEHLRQLLRSYDLAAISRLLNRLRVRHEGPAA